MTYPLQPADPASLGFRMEQIEALIAFIDKQIDDGYYPGCQIALARNGKLALVRSFGNAVTDPAPREANDSTLWLLYSNTKVITACAVWLLAERGALSFTDTVASHVPGFEKNGKGEITILQLLTHQGGFPDAVVPETAWADHELLRRTVSDFTLQWTPGSRITYHPAAAHWVAGVLIEAITKTDYRDFIRQEIAEPLGLANELFVGLPDNQHARSVDMHEPSQDGARQTLRGENNTAAFRRAGVPGGGGYATARAMAAFYQMLAQGGTLNGVRLLSPRMVQYVTRNFTDDRIDTYMGMPMHRGIGPHSRGTTPGIRGLGAIAHPHTFGHGGVGSSYCWADPDSGVSFAYLSNSRVPDPWHSQRLDRICTLAHSAIDGW